MHVSQTRSPLAQDLVTCCRQSGQFRGVAGPPGGGVCGSGVVERPRGVRAMAACALRIISSWPRVRSDAIERTPIDGRPRVVKRSVNDGEEVKIAAIDPDS